MALSWTDQYAAFTADETIYPEQMIVPQTCFPISEGLTFEILSPYDGAVLNSGTPGCISLLNGTEGPVTCGLLQSRGDHQFMPICAFAPPGRTQLVVTPVAKVLLMFTPWQFLTPGFAIEMNVGAFDAILIDFATDTNRTVTFDIDAGWSWGDGSWAKTIAPGASLVPILLQAGG